MKRRVLAGAAVAVVILVVLLLVELRQSGGPPAAGSPPPEPASTSTSTTTTTPDPTAPGAASDRPQAPRVKGLPTPEQDREARERIEAEHVRSPSHAPDLLDNNLQAQPMRAARRAFASGDFDSALARAEDALAVEPTSSSALVLAVLAACGAGKESIAQAHARKLDAMRQARVKDRCMKFGVELAVPAATP